MCENDAVIHEFMFGENPRWGIMAIRFVKISVFLQKHHYQINGHLERLKWNILKDFDKAKSPGSRH